MLVTFPKLGHNSQNNKSNKKKSSYFLFLLGKNLIFNPFLYEHVLLVWVVMLLKVTERSHINCFFIRSVLFCLLFGCFKRALKYLLLFGVNLQLETLRVLNEIMVFIFLWFRKMSVFFILYYMVETATSLLCLTLLIDVLCYNPHTKNNILIHTHTKSCGTFMSFFFLYL